MTMDSLINKFLELLLYVPYIRDEKVKIQQFISCLSPYFRDNIDFYAPKPYMKLYLKLDFVLNTGNIGLKIWKRVRKSGR